MDNAISRYRKPPTAPYSDAVEVRGTGRWIYFAGQMGGHWCPDGSYELPPSLDDQVRGVFENLRATLADVGAKPNHVVSMTVYLKRITDFPIYSAARTTFFGDAPPTSVVVETVLKDDSYIEIVPIAFVPDAG